VWYGLRSADALPRNFERHLVTALASVAALHRPVRTIEDALDSLEEDALVVLDDLQHASDKGSAILKDLLEHPRLHLVLASRVPPALTLARLRLQGHVVELTAADLAFTRDEVAALGLEGDPADLLRQTQGWPAAFGLIRFGGSLQAAASRRELFALLAEEVWSRLSTEERTRLHEEAERISEGHDGSRWAYFRWHVDAIKNPEAHERGRVKLIQRIEASLIMERAGAKSTSS
jgi:LuxR family maltose regulon positive regulatory protein